MKGAALHPISGADREVGKAESIVSQTLIIRVIRTSRLAFIESRASAPLMLTSLVVCAPAFRTRLRG